MELPADSVAVGVAENEPVGVAVAVDDNVADSDEVADPEPEPEPVRDGLRVAEPVRDRVAEALDDLDGNTTVGVPDVVADGVLEPVAVPVEVADAE